jgi:small subunit ribosomal protein S7
MRIRINKFRKLEPDPLYHSLKLAKFINYLMLRGQKETARKVVYQALEIIKKKTDDPLKVFEEAVKNVSPLLEVKSRRIGGATYQVPYEVKKDRQMTLAMKWIIRAARSVKGRPISKKLAQEIEAAAQGEGKAVQKKVNTHKMAKANQAFARFAR